MDQIIPTRGTHLKLDPGKVVEDVDFGNYRLTSAWDYGNGAAHLIDPSIYLGGLVDAESDGWSSALADGDDTLDGSDDEDGVIFTPVFARLEREVDAEYDLLLHHLQ